MMSEFWNKVHFWPTMILMNCIFFPMFLQGMAGMHRRMYDGGATYELLNKNVLHWNVFISESAWLMGLAQIPFIINFCLQLEIWPQGLRQSVGSHHARVGRAVAAAARQLHSSPIVAYRGPYEYSVPGASDRLHPAGRAAAATKPVHISGPHPPRRTHHRLPAA